MQHPLAEISRNDKHTQRSVRVLLSGNQALIAQLRGEAARAAAA